MKKEFSSKFSYEGTPNKWAVFCYINNIKVDIIHYAHPHVAPFEIIDGIRLLSTKDIAAMKINAIPGRASKKDFWDIYELLHHHKLEEIIDAHQKKYPQQILLISIPQALVYFAEVEEGENPMGLKEHTWDVVKKYI